MDSPPESDYQFMVSPLEADYQFMVLPLEADYQFMVSPLEADYKMMPFSLLKYCELLFITIYDTIRGCCLFSCIALRSVEYYCAASGIQGVLDILFLVLY